MTLKLRNEIVIRYRDRIQKGDRLRLSKDDLSGLTAGFIERLQSAKNETEIRTLCEAEIKLLEEGYPQPSVAKYLTVYRKAIVVAIDDGTLPLTPRNSHRFVHQQRVTGMREERSEHWALTYLKYSPEVYESIDQRSQRVNRDKQLNLRLVPVDRYLDLLRSFLDKKGQFEARWLAVAIAGLTGRRFAEVMTKGTFALTEHPHLLRFEGQLKSRAGRSEGYDIVTLFPAAEVLTTIERLRRLPEVKAIAKLKGAALSTALNGFNQKLNAMCGKVLMQVVPPLEGKKTVSVHNLRSLYGAIAVHFFCPELQHEYAFVQHFLGHVMDSPATGHYFRFALCNDQGQLIRDKGIQLDQVAPLPLQAKVQPSQIEADTEPTMMASEEQGLRNEWLEALDQRVATLRTEFEAELQAVRQENNVGWFVRRVEGLERENLQLRLERDRAIAQAEQGLDRDELARLRAENEAIAQELLLAKEKLDAFRQLLNGHDSKEPEEVQQTALLDRVALPPQSEGAIAQPSETENVARGPKAGKAFKRAEAIFLAIKDWNRLYPSESFAVNAGLMETVFRIHRQAAKDFFDAYQNEIWEYNQELGVESPRWHNRGKDTAKLKTFVEEKLKV
ncbi:MAG: protelomerase family protein [Thermosynechococcaceae cyanobacterium]